MARPAVRRQAVAYVVDRYRLSTRRACKIVKEHRSGYYYRSCKDPKAALRSRMRELAQIRIRYGYRRLHVLLKREGWVLGKEQAYRLYSQESLQLRSKRPRRRKMMVTRRERYVPKRPNQAWSMDFVADQLVNGVRFRALTIVDVYTREALAIQVGQRLRAKMSWQCAIESRRSADPLSESSWTTVASSPDACLISGRTTRRQRSTSTDPADRPTTAL